MSSPLYRTQLCKHGPSCIHPRCLFAHSLIHIRAPPPRDGPIDAWTKIHYFIGQAWDRDMINRFLAYARMTPIAELPLWALPALWLFLDLHILWQPFAGRDFGLSQRVECYGVHLPFMVYALQHKLALRLESMGGDTVGNVLGMYYSGDQSQSRRYAPMPPSPRSLSSALVPAETRSSRRHRRSSSRRSMPVCQETSRRSSRSASPVAATAERRPPRRHRRSRSPRVSAASPPSARSPPTMPMAIKASPSRSVCSRRRRSESSSTT